MKRSMMQVYVKDSLEAVALYQKAFDAKLVVGYFNDDGTYMHAELDIYSNIVAISESPEETITGNTMQFCFHFGVGNDGLVRQAYEHLSQRGVINYELGECSFSPLMTDLTDRFGVRWCLFV